MKHNLPKITCPYCGYKHGLQSSSLKRLFHLSKALVRCSNCGKRFIVRVEVYEIAEVGGVGEHASPTHNQPRRRYDR